MIALALLRREIMMLHHVYCCSLPKKFLASCTLVLGSMFALQRTINEPGGFLFGRGLTFLSVRQNQDFSRNENERSAPLLGV